MINRNKELLRNTIILGVGQLVPKLLSLITLPVLTAYLTTSQYGTYDLILSIVSLLIPIITLQIQQAVFRYLITSLNNEDRYLYVTNSLAYILLSSVICLPIVFITLTITKINFTSSILICFLLFAEALYNLLGQIVRGVGMNVKYSLSVIVYSVTNMLLILVLIAYKGLGLHGVILSLLFSYLMADLYMLYCSKIISYFKVYLLSKETIKQLLLFSAPIIPSSISLWVVNLSDRLIIINYLGTGANGIYSVANKIPSVYNNAYNIFDLAWTETASRAIKDDDSAAYYSSLFSVLFNFLIGIMLMLIALTPIMFKFLVDEKYYLAYYQVPILYFGVFFNSLVCFYSGIYIALKRTKEVSYSSIIGAILNLLFNLIFIKHIGIYAASISTAVSYFAIVLYRAYDINKIINIIYDLKNLLIGFALFIISAILCYTTNLLCIALCFVIAVLFNIKKNMFIIDKAILMFKQKNSNKDKVE